MVDKVKGSFEARSESHLPLADVLVTPLQIHSQSFSTLCLTSCPYELFSMVTWLPVLFGFRQQEVLGVISTGREAWVYSLGSFSTGSPSPYVTIARFSYFLLPLASPWLWIPRLPFSLALRSCITFYPHLVKFF